MKQGNGWRPTGISQGRPETLVLRTGRRTGGGPAEIWGKDSLGTNKYKRPVQMSAGEKCICWLVLFLIPGTEIWWWRQKWKSQGWGGGQGSRDEGLQSHGEEFGFYPKYREMPLKSAELRSGTSEKMEN